MDSKIKTIFWDFDGVILDSAKIRIFGFKEIFKDYPQSAIDTLITYHINNGGLSRFHKIEYFFKEILRQDISQERIENLANKFSEIMRENLTNKEYLIQDSITFIKNNYKKYNFYITSGSEQNELRFLCEKLGISQYFLDIFGSPTKKVIIIANILQEKKYNTQSCVLIGDSIHDYYAARDNKISFYGYNNASLKEVSNIYIESFKSLE